MVWHHNPLNLFAEELSSLFGHDIPSIGDITIALYRTYL